jgi:hypothetical protein
LSALSLAAHAQKADKLVVRFFGSRTCGECQEIKELFLAPLSKEFPKKLQVENYDLEEEKAFQLLLKLEEAHAVTQSSPQELFLPDTFLTGYDDIMARGESLIRHYLANPEKWESLKVITLDSSEAASASDVLKQKMDQFSLIGLVTAGLLDGVNPCAIATLIFLVSFLSLKKRKSGEILIIGLTFTAAVYITYLFMGLGALEIIHRVLRRAWIARVFKWGIILFAMTVAIISFKDAFAFKKSGKAKDVTLQLPKPVKILVHKIISQNLSGTQLFAGALIAGFLVTLLEAVCTGQFYIPVLTALASRMDPKAWMYLLFYNFLFVLPLLIVMILAYHGLKWEKLSALMQKNLPLLKILLGATLVALSGYLYLSM